MDFYVDEPACFGVPPYLSPYVRYAAGALAAQGLSEAEIHYMNVDSWREQEYCIPGGVEFMVIIAGHTVPGKYLGGKIGTVAEIKKLLSICSQSSKKIRVCLGGPIRYARREIQSELALLGGHIVRGDLENFIAEIFKTSNWKEAFDQGIQSGSRLLARKRHYQETDCWAERGAFITRKHPDFPYIINELETYRGCTRDVFCSFCTEAFYGKPEFRTIEGLGSEVSSLYALGNRYFRLGRQADLLTYNADMNDFKNSFPRPRPKQLLRLYQTVRQAAPELKLLHLDNINPGLIATFPEEAKAGLEIIAGFNTPGDTAAMGLETVDDAIIAQNSLKCNADQARLAIAIVNEAGGVRREGIPGLLPGLNFIHGLPGETDRTFKNIFEFLKSILDSGLALRRINIRQAVTYRNTRLARLQAKITDRKRERFLYFRDRIRKEIDKPMLAHVFPVGTVLKEVILEEKNQGYYLGRQLGSYPVTVKIPLGDPAGALAFARREPLDAIVLTGEERSLAGLSYPIRLNSLETGALALLPGISKHMAGTLKLRMPVNYTEYARVAGTRPFGKERDYDFTMPQKAK